MMAVDAGFLIFFGIFFLFWFGSVYLMWAHPHRWVQWFLKKPWKPFGLTVTIHDAAKLRKNLRRLGMFYFAVGMTVLVAIVLTVPALSR